MGVSGLVAIAEVALQLRGEAGALSVAHLPKVGLSQSMAGLGSQSFVTILGRAES